MHKVTFEKVRTGYYRVFLDGEQIGSAVKMDNDWIADTVGHAGKTVSREATRKAVVAELVDVVLEMRKNTVKSEEVEEVETPVYKVKVFSSAPNFKVVKVTELKTEFTRKFRVFPSGKIEDMKYPGSVVLEEVKNAIRPKLGEI